MVTGSQLGTVSILNVAGGDVKVSFDKSNPQESIRASRIISEMLLRGYALLVEVERDGERAFERATAFDADKNEYIIADYDPTVKPVVEVQDGEEEQAEGGVPHLQEKDRARPGKGRKKGIPVESTRAVAVARSAGG